MTTPRSVLRSRFLAAACVGALALLTPLAAAESPDSRTLMRAVGVEHGVLAVLGCGDGRQCVDLHAGGQFVVQGLDRDAEKVAAARGAIQSKGCLGPVSVRRLAGPKLPYADNLISLMVVEDSLGIERQEMLRVVRPLGVLLTREGETWTKTVKPWPADLDEWTHFLRDASGNAVSKDALVGPPRRLRWSAGPLWGRSHEMNNSFPALVTARGRIVYVFDRGLTGMEDPRLPERWTLIARDAFNGTLLWERPLPTWGSQTWGSRALRFFGGNVARRLVADGDSLYVTFEYGGPVMVLDAATGKTTSQIARTEGAEEILAQGDHLVVTGRAKQDGKRGAAWIACYEMPGGKLVWKSDVRNYIPQLTAAGDAEVVYHNGREVVCLGRKDGTVRWRVEDKPAADKRGGPRMLLVADGKAIVTSRQGITALAISDGEAAWKAPGPQGDSMRDSDLFVAQGAVWCSGPNGTIVGYRLEDGKPARTLDAGCVQSYGHHLRCYRAKATERHLITQFRGVEFVSFSDRGHCQNDWLRGTCTYGVMPANGLLYVPPHSCFCYAGAMYRGLNAFAADPSGADNEGQRFGIGPLEEGPAFGRIGPEKRPSDKAWPTYRHDARRTGATAGAIQGTLKRAWKAELGTALTPPVAADGRVFVAAKDRHTIHALNAATGELAWTFAADARIDSPPSVHRGLVVFGCADGCLYCVTADDGRLAWRRRLAPAERWMAVDGQLESVWRLHGSVLIEDGLAYCCAGRSSFLDGGLFLSAVEVATGEVRHKARLNTSFDTRVDRVDKDFVPSYHIEGAHSDVLVSEGGFIYLNQMRFSPELELLDAKYLTKEQVTGRPSINLDNKAYVNEDIFNVRWRGKRCATYDELAAILVDENQSVGERDLGRHLFTTSGFLDTTFFNRTYWMYAGTWPGFNHSNLAPKSGQILVIGPEKTYALKAYTSRYALSPRLDPQTKGYLLVADENENDPTLDPRAWGKDKGMGFSRGAPPVWHQWLPVRVQAMVLAGPTLAVCGPPDVVKEGDPMAAFEGRLGSRLCTFSAEDGKTLARQDLEETPIFDGMIAAEGRLLLCTQDGDVICME